LRVQFLLLLHMVWWARPRLLFAGADGDDHEKREQP
jgi:hypothetical protein